MFDMIQAERLSPGEHRKQLLTKAAFYLIGFAAAAGVIYLIAFSR